MTEEKKLNSSLSHLGQTPWNKGLTKETDPRLKSINTSKEHAQHVSEGIKEWWRLKKLNK
jgi:hypothetical protein